MPQTEHKETHEISPSPAPGPCSGGWLFISGVAPQSLFLLFKGPKTANLERISCAENHGWCLVPLGQNANWVL